MSSCAYWRVEDETGSNPAEREGTFEFRVWFDCNDAIDPPTIVIQAIECVDVKFDTDARTRKPTRAEDDAFSNWFDAQLDIDSEMRADFTAYALSCLYVGTADVI